MNLQDRNYTLNDIVERLEALEGMIKILVRQKMSNKQEKLMDEVMKKGRFDVKQTMNFLGISRPHALTLMEKLGKQFGFRFRKGDQNTRMPSIILYDKSLILQDQKQRIEQLLNTKKIVSFFDIMNEFGVEISEVKQIVKIFLDGNDDYEIKEGNKLVRKNGTVNSKST